MSSQTRDKVMASTERAKFGCIVTIRHRASGEMYSFHRPGTVTYALREIVETCIDPFFDDDWKVCCISTPVTVYTALHGARMQQPGNGAQPRLAPALFTEEVLLKKIGRADLLPSLDDPPMTLRRTA